MKVIPNLKSDTITPIVKERVDGKSDLLSDDSTSYGDLEQHVDSHTSRVAKPEYLQ